MAILDTFTWTVERTLIHCVLGPGLAFAAGRCVAWSMDGKRLAVGCYGTGAHMVDTTTWESVELVGRADVKTLAWSPNGQKLAICVTGDMEMGVTDVGLTAGLHVLDTLTLQVEKTVDCGKVNDISWTRACLALATEQGINIWDSTSFEFMSTVQLGCEVECVSLSGHRLAFASGPNLIISEVGNEGNNAVLHECPHPVRVSSIAWGGPGWLASCCGDGLLRFISSEGVVKTEVKHGEIVWDCLDCLAWSP